jgi:hypothetical protein
MAGLREEGVSGRPFLLFSFEKLPYTGEASDIGDMVLGEEVEVAVQAHELDI